jgi:hypothetical protein
MLKNRGAMAVPDNFGAMFRYPARNSANGDSVNVSAG